MSESATYVYCVVHRETPLRLRATGVPGGSAPVCERVGGALWIVTSEVPLEIYGPDAIGERLRDVKWVGQVALAHQQVVSRAAVLPGATAVPMKLFTMFSDRDKAVAEIRRNARHLDALVRRIRGCVEWGVRIVRANGHARPAPVARAASGTAFLAARKTARDRAREAAARSTEAADAAFRRLKRAAKRAALRTPPEGAAAPPLLDAAFLVPRSRAAAFRAEVRRAGALCADAGAELTLTGPWPAYSFLEPSGRAT